MTVTLRSTSLLHLDCGGTADHGALAVPLFQLPGPVLHPGGVGAWELTAWSAGQLIITATSAGLRLQARACMRLRLRHWAAGLPTKHLRRPPARPPLPACSATTCTPSTTWACWFSGVSLHRNRGGGGGGGPWGIILETDEGRGGGRRGSSSRHSSVNALLQRRHRRHWHWRGTQPLQRRKLRPWRCNTHMPVLQMLCTLRSSNSQPHH